MSNQETPLMHRIMLDLSLAGCLVFRNESALAWVGKVIHREGGIVTLKGATRIKCGLAVGSSDIIGLTADGRFFAFEVKTPNGDSGSKEQKDFITAVIAHGGIAGIVRSPEDALALIVRK